MKKVLTVTMDGIRYHASRPADCRHCFFWKNRKKGCVLGKENCYYLIEPPKGPSKCEGCPYKRAKPCVLVPCYDHLIGMDESNLCDILRLVGGDPQHKVSLLMAHTDHPREVADPWFTGDFESTWQDILEGCTALLEELRS